MTANKTLKFILRKAISTAVLMLFSFFVAIIPLIFTSSLISDHFYYWVDELSENHVALTIALMEYSLESNDEGKLIKIIDGRIAANGRIFVKIAKNNQVLYEKNFSEKYQSRGLGRCQNITHENYHIQYCSPAYPSAWYSLKRYVTCLFNGEVFTQFKYTDYFLLHIAITFLILSLLNSYRIHRKNVLIKRIYKKISPKLIEKK